jgi:2-polyprenyl-3-methyl-5-hydroxy-6-metoxy-1,4-benzoquinol methylase
VREKVNINFKEKRETAYYSRARTWPLLFNLRSTPRILDIGCGQGTLGQYLKDKIDAEVCGLEITPNNFDIASKVLNRTLLGDVESMDLSLLGTDFDYVIFSDSLEHLVDPGRVLQNIKSVMSEDGSLLIALPNTRNFRVTLPLLFLDRWEYTDEGLLDRTHLRFFTLTSITQLLQKSGYNVEDLYYDLPRSSKVGLLNIATFGLFRKILTSHYFIKACIRKKS